MPRPIPSLVFSWDVVGIEGLRYWKTNLVYWRRTSGDWVSFALLPLSPWILLSNLVSYCCALFLDLQSLIEFGCS